MKIKKCEHCNRDMAYNYHYQAYECKCGKVYNAVGQELAPIENWAEEYNDYQ
ncbi:hypothetical protein [Terribacillus saccharophilus]|uniref:hypothetical protein n=1 Tax=Terribacillus saccharophilus TaxID=361277 RepID=UPI00298A072D|nr:hypothetical protein [Terribacillus saccharophilus]MCM3227549.1 hypothetical protein [Terribacillus saccharophilus]